MALCGVLGSSSGAPSSEGRALVQLGHFLAALLDSEGPMGRGREQPALSAQGRAAAVRSAPPSVWAAQALPSRTACRPLRERATRLRASATAEPAQAGDDETIEANSTTGACSARVSCCVWEPGERQRLELG